MVGTIRTLYVDSINLVIDVIKHYTALRYVNKYIRMNCIFSYYLHTTNFEVNPCETSLATTIYLRSCSLLFFKKALHAPLCEYAQMLAEIRLTFDDGQGSSLYVFLMYDTTWCEVLV